MSVSSEDPLILNPNGIALVTGWLSGSFYNYCYDEPVTTWGICLSPPVTGWTLVQAAPVTVWTDI